VEEAMPYTDDDGLVECGHGDESYCDECGGCLDCSNCYCDDGDFDDDDFDDDDCDDDEDGASEEDGEREGG
jgi:hypothetical protein